MDIRMFARRAARFSGVAAVLALSIVSVAGQDGGRQGAAGQAPAAQAAPTGRAMAPIDLTGYWVALITDDWRWRMVTPPKGDVLYLPVTDAARRAAEQWDPAKDEAAGEACKGYGAGGIMRLPERLHITWDNDNALKMEIDTGQQTRIFNFAQGQGAARGGSAPAPAEPTWQGTSVASWDLPAARGRGARAGGPVSRPGTSLKVVTTRMRPGYWQKNGVPYSGNAVMTEWYTTITEPDNSTYLVVTKLLEDPQYIQGAYYRTVQFKKQNDATGWNPTPCSAR